MKRMCKHRITAFILAFIMLFTTGCSSGFYADELETVGSSVSGNDEVNENSINEDITSNVSVSGNEVESEYYQFHYIDGDSDSFYDWLELYQPNSVYADFLALPDEWWNGLYDYEREMVDFLEDESVFVPDENLYSNEEIDECIDKIESGIDSQDFFDGTWLEDVSLEELKFIRDAGYTMEDIDDVIVYINSDEESQLSNEYLYQENLGNEDSDIVELFNIVSSSIEESKSEDITLNTTPKMRKASARIAEGEAYYQADLTVKMTGGDRHDPIYRITLGGVPALCYKEGAHCNSSMKYILRQPAPRKGHAGYYAKLAASSQSNYLACQIALWVELDRGFGLSELQCKAAARSRVNHMSDTNAVRNIANMVWKFYSQASNHLNDEFYLYYPESSNAQPLITYREGSKIIFGGEIEPPEPGPGGDTPEPPTVDPNPGGGDGEGEIIDDFYDNTVPVTTTITVNKRDIETGKPLEDVSFWFGGDIGQPLVTDANGNCSWTIYEKFSDAKYWQVTTGDHEVKVGEDSHGNDIKETKYYYTCEECGQSGDYDSSGSRNSEAKSHCYKHCYDYVEASIDSQIAAYKVSWSVTETMPRTTSVNLALVTGGSDSYTQGYHNNPIITASNTESGYHRGEHRVKTNNWTNERVRGTITINKSDMDYLNCRTEGDNNQDFIPQGDASLAGAVYGLYANADIIRPDGKSGVDRTGLPTNIRMDYCTGSVDDPSAHKTYSGVNPFGIDAIHT